MTVSGENLRFILGLKLRQFRSEKGYSLKELAGMANLSISYLSEIEKGKKYPKPEKILRLAKALEIPFDDLVSLQVNRELDPLTAALSSPVIQEFPFQMYGISPQSLIGLMTDDPQRAGALIRTFLEIAQAYDMRVEHLLFAALRSYQQMHLNYFEEIEAKAVSFINRHSLDPLTADAYTQLQQVLTGVYGYTIDEETLAGYDKLEAVRSVCIENDRPVLLIKGGLQPIQKAFEIGREIAYQYLGLSDRPKNFSPVTVDSFEQLLNNFKATYFAGALLINRDRLCEDISEFFSRNRWDGNAFLSVIQRYDATEEMFLHRLSEVLPTFFNMRELLFFGFRHHLENDRFRLTKTLNMTRMFLANTIGQREHDCRRWLVLRLLRDFEANQRIGDSTALIAAQRSRFLDQKLELFTIAMAGPADENRRENRSGSISFVVDDNFRQRVKFWNDPSIPLIDVNETCERCALTTDLCKDRAAPPVIFERQMKQNLRQRAFAQLLQDVKPVR